jgi:pimeloyl-ACP methyl ester carboxylesterase
MTTDTVAPAVASTVVLLPGLLCDAQVWADQIEHLQALGARCHVPDYGQADSLTTMAQQVLSDTGIGTGALSVAGHSMGGRVALEMARLAPRRIRRLALMDTGIDALPAGADGEAERDKRLALVRLGRSRGMAAMARLWAAGMVHPARLDTPLFEAIVAMVARKTPAIHQAQITALLDRPDARAVLQGLSGPTLLLCGRQDAWSPLAQHEQMQALLPSARLVAIEDAGHMVTLEQPAAVNRALADWLAMD